MKNGVNVKNMWQEAKTKLVRLEKADLKATYLGLHEKNKTRAVPKTKGAGHRKNQEGGWQF